MVKILRNVHRTEQFLEEAIKSLEELAVSRTLTSRRLESMLDKLRGIRRSMQRLDKSKPEQRAKFWKLSRRAVIQAVKIKGMLSAA